MLCVGIGASAGGLGALEQFFQHLPADTGLAFVVITPQSPDQTTILPELLSKQTATAVHHVDTDVQIAPNPVYLPKPGSVLNIQGTPLRGIVPADAETRPSSPLFPSDTFFRSLAEDRQETAMGVILSGTGTDGTRGMTMAQAEATAQFAGMPPSAIASGMVDYVVSASDMPHTLLSFARRLLQPSPETAHAEVLPEQLIQDI